VAANGPLPGWLLAAATEPTAKETLQKNIDQVQRALKGNNAKKLSQLAANLIDFDEFSRATLARFWDQLSETERSDFVHRFSTVIQSNYVGRIQQAGSFSVSITGETPEDEALWVESEAVAEKGSRLKTDYLFVQRSGTWRVVDIRVEGVRLSERYAHSFGRVIRRDGFPALLERLGPKARKKKHRPK
jgi:phospholipid transport system substrate-binding protein